MADAKLSREHALALLHKLGHDDEFRARFQKNPVAGLHEVGVPKHTVAALPPESITVDQLPDKESFRRRHEEVSLSTASEHSCMVFPTVWFGPENQAQK
ncbi:MAG: NHLP-related RiPP peptide [Xanthomonadaceae bacterium]|nr:NHLP-related RiPP peptide [Xanthomonadaceae bacterium]